MGQRITVDQDHPSQDAINIASDILVNEGVVIMPTDSVYGIGCLATPANPAHTEIFRIKKRNLSQTLPWLIADIEDLERYGADLSQSTFRLAKAFWPGALTLVVRASAAVPEEYAQTAKVSEHSDTANLSATIALRMPDSNFVRSLVRACGIPLAVTSANTHGLRAANSAQTLEDVLCEEADLVLDAGPAPVGVASTIIDCTTHTPQVLREGAIAVSAIKDALDIPAV